MCHTLLLFIRIATQICLAWFLGPAERGAYEVCLLFIFILTTVFIVGCDIAWVYLVSSKQFSISEGVANILVYEGIGSGFAIVTGLAIMQMPLTLLDKATPEVFCMALITSILSLSLLRLLTAVHQFGRYAIVSLLCRLFKCYSWSFSYRGFRGVLRVHW